MHGARLGVLCGIVLAALAALSGRAGAEELTISAAISLQKPLESVRPALEKAAGLPVALNFGASGALAAQITRGAPVDLFISADGATMDRLDSQALLLTDSRANLASNSLVLIVPARGPGSITTFADLGTPACQRVAIGDPAVVPAGQYARQTLGFLGLYDGLHAGNKLVTAENVAQVLTYVARGEVDAGIVYATDARNSDAVRRVAAAPAGSHDPIVYVMAIPKGAPHGAAARAARGALLAPDAQSVLASFGFTRVDAGAATTAATTPADQAPRAGGALLKPWLLSGQIAGLATLIAVLLGVPLAWMLSRRRFPGQFLLETALLLPLVLPPTVIGFGLLYVLGQNGLAGHVAGISLLFTRTGATIACTAIIFPLIVIPCRAAFASIASSLLEDAQLLGATRLQLLIYVAIPLAARGILCGILLGFARALGEFGATIMIVGTNENVRTLPIQIYSDAALTGDIGRAAPAVLALAVTSAIIALILTRLRVLSSN